VDYHLDQFSRVCSADSYTLLTEQCSALLCQTNRPFQTSSEKHLIDGLRSFLFFFSLFENMNLYDPTGYTQTPTTLRMTFIRTPWTDGPVALVSRHSEAFRLTTATVEGSIHSLSRVNSGVAIDLGTDRVSFLRSKHARLTGSVSVCQFMNSFCDTAILDSPSSYNA
jgi:hypothetical protein